MDLLRKCRESWCSARFEASRPGVLESGTRFISYPASILSASSRPDSIIFLASASSRVYVGGTVNYPSTTVVVELVHPHLRGVPGLLPYLVLLAHGRARDPHQRTRRRNTCTMRDLCIISRLVLSCTLLCAGASSGSADSRSRSARRARPLQCRRPRVATIQLVARRVVHGRHGGSAAPRNTCTLLALVPVAYISATAATRARSARRWRSITPSGKRLPERSLGMRSVSGPTQVASDLSR